MKGMGQVGDLGGAAERRATAFEERGRARRRPRRAATLPASAVDANRSVLETAMIHAITKGPWARSLCSLAAVAALLVLSAEAQAQTERKLVGNTTALVGTVQRADVSVPLAQRFNTGSHAQGYTLNKVQVDYNSGSTFSVKVCTVTGADQPTATCVDFTPPGTLSSGINTFTAPSGGVQLAGSTAYAVVLTPQPGGTVHYVAASNDGEDADGLSGWNIAGEFRLESGAFWVADGASRALRMNLRGHANPLATLVSNTGQTTSDSAQVGQSDNQVTQTFTTGSNAGGYQLESVDIDVGDADLEAGETFTAHIYTALCTGHRGELVYTLTSPATYADGAVNRFAAPAGARLAPATDYMVVMEGTGDDPLDFTLDTTDSGAEDAGFATGWTIENGFRNRNLLDANDTLKIGIRGSALGADTTLVGSLDTDGLLCARLTVGFDQNRRGYLGEGDEYGDLSRDRFTIDSTTYRVKSIRWAGPRGGKDGDGPRLHLTLDRELPEEALEYLTLKIGAHTFPLWEAGRSNSFEDESNNYRWQDPPSELRNAREGTVFGVELLSNASDATLRSLELRNVPRDGHSFPHPDYDPEFALTPEFAPGTTTGYAAEVPHLTDTITVDARTAARAATVRYLDGGNLEIADANGRAGHQVALSSGANTINVEVTSGDGSTSVYGVTVTRQPRVILRYSGPHDHDDDILHMTMSGTSAEPEISGTETAVRCLGRPFLLRDEHGTTLEDVSWSLDPRIRNDGLVYRGSEMFAIGADGQVRTVVGVDYAYNIRARIGVEYFRVRGTDRDSGGYARMLVRANFLHPDTELTEPRRSTNACVSAAAQEQEPLTGEFRDVPASHDGASDFTLRLSFSEEVEISPEDLRDHALSARAGTVTAVTRVDGAKDLFQVTVRPDGDGTVSVTLGPTPSDCTAEGAVCTSGRVALTSVLLQSVPGPTPGRSPRAPNPALTVADAEATEGTDTALQFVVTLSPSAQEKVTVAYETSDGTATAGSDYDATSGTLSFAVGDTTKTVQVAIRTDTVADDGETVNFTLSNAAGATIDDAQAVGTINDATPEPLTASFGSAPASHDGSTAFTVRLGFSEALPQGSKPGIRRALTTTGGSVKTILRVDDRLDLWEVKVEPSGTDAVTLSLASTGSCGDEAAICTADGRALSNAPSVTVDGPPAVALTASFQSVPASHDGSTAFTLRLGFTEALPQGSKPGIRRALTTTGGSVKTILRVDNRLDLWEVKLQPSGTNAVTLSLASTGSCGDEAAICTADGRALSNTPSVTVNGPSTAAAIVNGPLVTLKWGSPRDDFGSPSGTDYGVRVNGFARAVVSAELAGTTAWLTLASPIAAGDMVTVAYLGSAMHPLAEATGQVRSEPWDGLPAENRTGVEPLVPPVGAGDPRPADPLAGAADDALRLDASGLGLTELRGLGRLAALERLDLSDNAVAEISPLAGLPNLRDLDLSGNRVTDLWPLAALYSLERLDLSDTGVTDLRPLAELSNLTVLLLDRNGVADTWPLAGLGKLENLGLGGNRIGDVTPLQDLPRLRRLDLTGNPAADLSPLGDVGSLVWLTLPGHRVGASAAALGRLTELRWVWFGTVEVPPNDVPGRRWEAAP